MGCNVCGSDAPDYTPMAEASAESARIMGDLGNAQLDFTKEQFAAMQPIYSRLVASQERTASAQNAIAGEAAAQAKDYFDYQKSFRPVEQQMLAESMKGNPERTAAFDAANQADAAAITQGDTALIGANKAEIDSEVARAVADANGGYTRSVNQAIRQAARYGVGGAGIAANAGGVGLAQAQHLASTATGARDAGISKVRQRLATGLQLRSSNMQSLNAQENLDWAHKLDAAGLVKGLPGASSAAYGAASAAGQTAVGAISSAANMATKPGDQAMAGMAQGASTIGQGRTLYQNGLGSILNSQSQGQGDTAGSLIGAAGGVAAAFI